MTNNYRKGIGAVILNNQNMVFVAKRLDFTKAWQMPQGGIDENELPEEALLREIKEETGITNLEIIGKTPLMRYELPEELRATMWNGKHIGQEQVWFFVKFKGEESEINLNASNEPEFQSYQWINKDKLVDHVVDFKKDMYKNIVLLGEKLKIF